MNLKIEEKKLKKKKGFPGGSEVKNPQANAGDSFPIPDPK